MSIEKFFNALKDGAWHSIEELSTQLAMRPGKVKKLADILSSHGVLKYESKTNRIRIEPEWKLLLPIEEKPTEPKTTLNVLHTGYRNEDQRSVTTDPKHRQRRP